MTMRVPFGIMVVLFFTVSCAHLPELSEIKTPVVSLTNVRYEDVGVVGLIMETEVQIENPNVFPVSLSGLSYTLSLNEVTFGRGRRAKKLKIKAYSARKLDIPIQLTFLEMASSVMNAIGGKSGKYKIEGEMFLRTASGDHPRHFSREGTVNFFQKP